MNSQKDVLQVLVSDFKDDTNATTLATLPVGEIGFFDAANAIAASGAGRFVLNNGGELIESSYVKAFAGWASAKAYAAPTLHKETLTLSGAVVAGTLYLYRVEMDIKGMTGKYIKEAPYKAVAGDTTTTIATALKNAMNAALTREGNTALTVTSSGAVITTEGVLQPYVPGKKLGNAVPFRTSITSPDTDQKLGTVTVVGSRGVGTGNWVHAKEFFAWGNQDAFRYNSWRNNFEPKVLSSASKSYITVVVDEKVYMPTANADVPVNLQIIVALNKDGSASAT
jgi:hypothetical protein